MVSGSLDIALRLAAVRDEVAAACLRAGRDPGDITIVGVTKGQPAAAVIEALAAGLTDFGENYVQEFVPKAAAVDTAAATLSRPAWHFIGHLQRNKVAELLRTGVRALHSLDSVRLVQAIERQHAALRRTEPLDCYVEVNIAAGPARSGALLEDLSAILAAAERSPALRVLGLMTIAPETSDAEETRPYFRQLRELARAHGLSGLSMGMTNDFRVAIEEGATAVRIGRAIFGDRPAN